MRQSVHSSGRLERNTRFDGLGVVRGQERERESVDITQTEVLHVEKGCNKRLSNAHCVTPMVFVDRRVVCSGDDVCLTGSFRYSASASLASPPARAAEPHRELVVQDSAPQVRFAKRQLAG